MNNEGHFHLNATHFFAYGVSAVLFINLLRWGSTAAANSNGGKGLLASIGRGVGATVHFGS